MRRLAPVLRDLLQRGEPAVLVTVADAKGPAPRDAGAGMLVTATRMFGTVGGGRLEHQALERARDLLARPASEGGDPVQEVPLGLALGQSCGGRVTLRLERASAAVAERLAAWPEEGQLVVLFGAGHVGRAIARTMAPLPCRLRWIDSRAEQFPDPPPEDTEVVVADQPAAEVPRQPAGAHFLVMTHSHDLDYQIAEAVLRRGDFAFLGLIGSASKRAQFERRWRARGLPGDALARLVCPIGLPGLRDKRPPVIAVSVAAQLLLTFQGAVDPRAAPRVDAPA